jgi:phosphatidylglycerol:prolipoprotein diacylglycerol transferase
MKVTELGLNQVIYEAFTALGFTGVIIFNLWNCKHYGFSKKKSLLYTIVVYTLTFLWMYIMYWAESGFQKWGGNNIVRVFVWLPVVAFPISKLMNMDWKKSLDFIAPCICINHGIAHFGCIFAGCCRGYAYTKGLWNPVLKIRTFPIQPIEAITATAIAVVLGVIAKKNDYKTKGYLYPLMLILFGYSRFFFEFGRDNNKLFLGISNLALHALFAGVVGTVWMILQKRNGEKM